MAHIVLDRRTQDVKTSQDVNFETMLLETKTLNGLQKSGFIKPSPIQLHGIPLGKCGFDLLLEAKSGTGKTAVFTVITLEKFDPNVGLQTIILAPTREIAAQICDVIKLIGSQYDDLKVEVVMGGLPVQEDIDKFKKPVHVVVGSPGRLKHLIQDKHIKTAAVRLLVLDEADKLMEKSFLNDIHYIFNALPKQKQVVMSSATFPEEHKELINKYVKNAQHICPDSTSILLGIVQKYTVVKYNINIVRQTQHRFEELLKILSWKPFKQCIIFCNYQARVSELYKLLSREKWPAEQLHGQQEQTDRLDTLKTLQEYKCRILISTDLAARGIDASNVDLVINFEPPYEWQTYLHRIGRAGRYGSYGTSITILAEGKEYTKFQEIISSMEIKVTKWWSDKDCESSDSSDAPNGESLGCLPLKVDTMFKTYDTLWQTFTKKSDDTVKITESFEKMCESYQKQISSSTIETFSDLIESYSKSQHQVQSMSKVSYKHMKVNVIPEIKEFLEDLNSVKNDESRFNTLVQSQQPGNSIVNNDLGERDECNSNVTYTKFKNKKNGKHTTHLQTNSTVDETRKKSWHEKYLFKEEDLIRAELPAAFCSHKDKNTDNVKQNWKKNDKTIKEKITKHMNRKIKDKNALCTDEEENLYYSFCEKLRHKNVEKSNKKHQIDSHKICHSVSCTFEEDNFYHTYIEELRSKINKKKLNYSNGLENDSYSNCGKSRQFNKKYPYSLSHFTKWDQQLWFRVQQIEMITYIQEMSKFKFYN